MYRITLIFILLTPSIIIYSHNVEKIFYLKIIDTIRGGNINNDHDNINNNHINNINNPTSITTRPDFVFGKDRELIHASIDLKWLFQTLTDRNAWLKLINKLLISIKRMNISYDYQYKYFLNAIDILINIRDYNPNSLLRIFQNSLTKAEQVAILSKRFILYYIEDDYISTDTKSFIDTTSYHKALSNLLVGNIINEKFIFMASNKQQFYAQEILQRLQNQKSKHVLSSAITKYHNLQRNNNHSNNTINKDNTENEDLIIKSYPTLIVLVPSQVYTDEIYNKRKWYQKRLFHNHKEHEFEIISILNLNNNDINPDNIIQYLLTILNNHHHRLYSTSTTQINNNFITSNEKGIIKTSGYFNIPDNIENNGIQW